MNYFYFAGNPQQQHGTFIDDGLSSLSVAPQISIMNQQQSQHLQEAYAIPDLSFQNHGQVSVVYGNSSNQQRVNQTVGLTNQHLEIRGSPMIVNSQHLVSNQIYGRDHLSQQNITDQNNLLNQQRIGNIQLTSGHEITMPEFLSVPSFQTIHVIQESLGETALPDAVEQEVGQMGMTFLEDKDDEIFDCTPAEDENTNIVTQTGDSKQVKPRKPKGVKKKKDPNAPQAAMSAYSFFFKETQLKVKAANPSAKFGDVSRSVSILWERLDENQKVVYRRMQEQDKLRYTKEMVEYKILQNENKDMVTFFLICLSFKFACVSLTDFFRYLRFRPHQKNNHSQ